MQFEGMKTKYPDIVMQEKSGVIAHLFDVKTDFGWNRNGVFEFCEKWEENIEKIKGTKTHFNLGETKEKKEGRFSKNLNYHIIVISKINSGKNIDTYIEK